MEEYVQKMNEFNDQARELYEKLKTLRVDHEALLLIKEQYENARDQARIAGDEAALEESRANLKKTTEAEAAMQQAILELLEEIATVVSQWEQYLKERMAKQFFESDRRIKEVEDGAK